MFKYKINISFPLGAKFNSNIDTLIYKLFLKMLHRLSCINVDSKCNQCPLSFGCQYYLMTGENFKGYPGILLVHDTFSKSFFRNNEEFEFEMYLIGNNETYKSYIEIFFLEYLNYNLIGNPFQIKKMEKEKISINIIECENIKIKTLIEENNFIKSYNAMINYYNSHYKTNYTYVETDIVVRNIKNISLPKVSLTTAYISRNGFVYELCGRLVLPEELIQIGIGKYNYLGGGRVEIKNSIKSE